MLKNIRLTLTTLLAALMLLSLGLLSGCTSDPASTSIETGQAVAIDDLLASPRSFRTNTLATGTITTFSTQGNVSLIGVVDNDHILLCRNLDCIGSKIYALNVSGQPDPDPGDVVTMTGEFEQQGDFWIFMISGYTVNNNIIELLQ